MVYDEHLLVELIAEGELSHGEIAERVGTSRRTVWSIANGRTRPDLQQEIADTVQGYRAATVRLAAKHMQTLLKKQIEVALEDSGETARKAREFLLKHFMQILSDEPTHAADKRRARLDEKRQIHAEEEYDLNLERQREDDPRYWTEEDWAEYRQDMADTADDTDNDDGICHEMHEPARRVGGPARRGGRRERETVTTNDLRLEANTQHSTRNTQVPSDDNGNDNGNDKGDDNGAGEADDEDAGRKKVDPYHRLPGETVIEASRRHMRETSERLLAEHVEDQASRSTGRCSRRS